MADTERERLTDSEVQRGLAMVIRDGLATQAMVTMTGGVILVAFALQLGASNTMIGLLAAIPPLGELLQIPGVYLVEKAGRRRELCVAASMAARIFWLVIAAIPLFFVGGTAIGMLVVALGCYAGLSSISHCAWNSWMRDLVPPSQLGYFFSSRMRLSTVVAIVLSLAAAAFLDLFRIYAPAFEIFGFSALFVAGYIAGLVGVSFLSRTPEPRMIPSPRLEMGAILATPFQDGNFRRLLFFLGSWNFAVNLAAPFFTVYMLVWLRMEITFVIALAVLSQVVSIAFYRIWGQAADRFSNKSVLLVSGPIFMFCILGWTFTTLPDVYVLTTPLLVLIHVFTGISTAGVSLASGNIGLKLAPGGCATAYLAASTIVNSVAAGIAPIVGGLSVDFFAERALSWTLTWQSPSRMVVFETLDFQHWDFFFVIAFVIGLYSLHRLGFVREEGEVKEEIVAQELVSEVMREMRNFSTAGGIRNLVEFPFVLIREARECRLPGSQDRTPDTE